MLLYFLYSYSMRLESGHPLGHTSCTLLSIPFTLLSIPYTLLSIPYTLLSIPYPSSLLYIPYSLH